MSTQSQASWRIISVLLNSQAVLEFEGFERLTLDGNCISIQPIGIEMTVLDSNSGQLSLESRGQPFLANFENNDRTAKLTLTRPEFNETVTINARVQTGHSCETVEREVVQV